jgi:hypothetical protein
MLFEKYSNEASFRSDFVRPLLTKMGFLAIAELDGSQEFGKDFVFSELTPFGFFRHYGVVVKHEKAIRQTSGNLCQTVLSQVRQAFSVSFRLPDSSNESHISSVLVLNSGVITPNARTWLRSELVRERYGDNVYIFDGERLSQLDLQVAFQHRELLVPQLVGLETNLKLNRVVWVSIAESLPSFKEGRGCFTQALEDYLAAPFLSTHLDSQAIATLLQECRIINTINQRYLAGIRVSDELKTREVETMRGLIAKADARAIALQSSVQRCLTTFRPVSG